MSRITEILIQQSKAYKKHYNLWKKAETTIAHQYKLQEAGKIPKKHKPKPPQICVPSGNSKKVIEEFQFKYKHLFFECLQEAITQNTLTLELGKARCRDILRRTEELLNKTAAPLDQLQESYTEFLIQNKVDEQQRIQSLQALSHPKKPLTKQTPPQTAGATTSSKEQSIKDTTPLVSKRKKRKNPETSQHHPKQLKLDHFLGRGQKQIYEPP